MSRVQVKLIHGCQIPGRYGRPGEVVSLSMNQARAYVSSGRAMYVKISPPTPIAPEAPDLYSCPHCDKEYKTESGLNNHLASKHTDE